MSSFILKIFFHLDFGELPGAGWFLIRDSQMMDGGRRNGNGNVGLR
jgi:hypothetical protein